MSEQIKQIAMRIAELRKIAGLSVGEMAKNCGVDVETYELYESGATKDIPIGFLYEVASYFNVELTTILTGNDPTLRTYSLVRAERGVHVERLKDYQYSHLAYKFADRIAEPFLVEILLGATEEAIPLNAHPGQEMDYVLSGKMRIQLGDRFFDLEEGDTLYFDSSILHGMIALSPVCRFLAIVL